MLARLRRYLRLSTCAACDHIPTEPDQGCKRKCYQGRRWLGHELNKPVHNYA
jgi:hypothetical protein